VRKRTNEILSQVHTDLDMIKTIVMIREPATVQAADAYEGLRKAVIAGAAERTAHLQQLARLDAEVSRGAGIEDIERLLRDLLAEAGLHRMTKVPLGGEGAFDVVGGEGPSLRVLEPAYFAETGGSEARLVRTGKAERVAHDTAASPPAEESMATNELSGPAEDAMPAPRTDDNVEAAR